MRVLQHKIENFRGIKSASLSFDGHTCESAFLIFRFY